MKQAFTTFFSYLGTDLKLELALLKEHMIQKFQNQGCSPIDDVDEFQILCYEAGAQTLQFAQQDSQKTGLKQIVN